MERITIELPIVKVGPNNPIFGSEFASEHYKDGLMIVDDGMMRHIVYWDGSCVYNCPCPHEVIEKHIVEKAVVDNDAIYYRYMETIEDRLSQIARLLDEVKVEARKSENRLTDTIVEQSARQVTEFNILRDKGDAVIDNFAEVRDDMLDIIEDKLGRLPKSCDGANVLDVAKAFAVISKPELIKELNK